MKKWPQKRQGGELDEGLIILVTLVIIIFLFVLPRHGVNGPTTSFVSLLGGTYRSGSMNNNPSNDPNSNNTSSYSNNIFLSLGNAPYVYEPFQEYITLINQGSKNIDITGWKVKNNKDARGYAAGDNVQHFPADVLTLPQATKYISPTGNNVFGDIVLKPGETAIITTGSTGVASPYKIVNFKENICSGYIEALPDYAFTPPLQVNCPVPNREIGYSNLDQGCQRFLDSFPSCHTPVYNGVDYKHEACDGCVDGNNALSSSCVAFIKSHYSYAGCINNHKDDPNFESNQWRIFLGQRFEIWGKDHEAVTLIDSSDNQVSSYAY